MLKTIRPKVLHSKTVSTETGCGELFITLCTSEDSKLMEVFIALDHKELCQKCQLEALSRLISISQRYGTPLKEVINQLIGIRCDKVCFGQKEHALSCVDAIAKVIKIQFPDEFN